MVNRWCTNAAIKHRQIHVVEHGVFCFFILSGLRTIHFRSGNPKPATYVSLRHILIQITLIQLILMRSPDLLAIRLPRRSLLLFLIKKHILADVHVQEILPLCVRLLCVSSLYEHVGHFGNDRVPEALL